MASQEYLDKMQGRQNFRNLWHTDLMGTIQADTRCKLLLRVSNYRLLLCLLVVSTWICCVFQGDTGFLNCRDLELAINGRKKTMIEHSRLRFRWKAFLELVFEGILAAMGIAEIAMLAIRQFLIDYCGLATNKYDSLELQQQPLEMYSGGYVWGGHRGWHSGMSVKKEAIVADYRQWSETGAKIEGDKDDPIAWTTSKGSAVEVERSGGKPLLDVWVDVHGSAEYANSLRD
ncbi:hypothetical protein CK203_015509 [Vitis vinifera]|uniref:Uncharacterized protein n=1 Tax=Vitis vinifera TaxID=29760 RepID=A0A438J535_VITVI|nr:hypothetical protein CK203_015509 [Vitis vinifera]